MPYAARQKDLPAREVGERGYAAFKYMREVMLMLNRVNEQYTQYRQPGDPDVETWEEMLREIMNNTVQSSHHKRVDDQTEKLYRQDRLRDSMQALSMTVLQKLKKSLMQNQVDYDDFLIALTREPWTRSKAWKEKRDSHKSDISSHHEFEQAIVSDDDLPLARRHDQSMHEEVNHLPPIVSSDDESQVTNRDEPADTRVEMRKFSGSMMESKRLSEGFSQLRQFADQRIMKAYVRGGMYEIQDEEDYIYVMRAGPQMFVCASTNQECRDLVRMKGVGRNHDTFDNGQGATHMDNVPGGQISPANAFGT